MKLNCTPRSRTVRVTTATLALLAQACAVGSVHYLPGSTDHPTRPAAQEGEIVHPGAWLARSDSLGAAPAEGASTDEVPRYICPMHPEVGAPTPGHCPRCDMVLEDRAPSSSSPSQHGHEH